MNFRITRRQFLAMGAMTASAVGVGGALPNLGRPSVLALEAPVIVPRSGWGADESYRFSAGSEIWPRQLEHYVKVIVHHTVTSDGADDVAAVIQSIYYYHAVTLGWGDIGYNFLIDQAGTIYEGRAGGRSVVGGHAFQHNGGAVGIAAIGTFASEPPSPAMLGAYVDLVTWICHSYGIDPRGSGIFVDEELPNVLGHRDANNTTCPGDGLFGQLGALRNGAAAALPEYGQAWVGHNTPATIEAGEMADVTVSLRNGGTLEWTQDVYRLGYRWRDKGGNIVSGLPGDDIRTSIPATTRLGEEATITTPVIAPRTGGGAFTLEFDLVHEGATWLSNAGAAPLQIGVQVGRGIGDAVSFIGHNAPPGLAPGVTTTVSLAIRNTGSTIWFAAGEFPYRIGYRWYDESGSQILQTEADDLRTALPRDLFPNETVNLDAQLRAPQFEGPVRLVWDVLRERVDWFVAGAGSPLVLPLQLAGVPYRAQFLDHNQPTFMKPGTTETIRMRLRNFGADAWLNVGNGAYRLGYRWYQGVGQQYSQNSVDDIRTALPQVLEPGQDIVFDAEVTAPDEEGIYRLVWDVVHEGFTWFEDAGSSPLSVSVIVSSVNPVRQDLPLAWRSAGL